MHLNNIFHTVSACTGMGCHYNLQGVKEGIPDCVMGGGLLGLLRVSVARSTSTGSSERTSPYTAALADAWSKLMRQIIRHTHVHMQQCTLPTQRYLSLWKPTDTRHAHVQIIHMQAPIMTSVPCAFKDVCTQSLSNSLPYAARITVSRNDTLPDNGLELLTKA